MAWRIGVAIGAVLAAGPAWAQTQVWSEPTRTERWTEAPAPKAKPAPAAACPHGAAVSVLYGGQWYPARIKDGPDPMGTCLVAYDGYGSNWDEWVAPARIRAAAAWAAAPRPAPSPRPAQAPAGRYRCYTFDAGQLNYAYTDVVIGQGGAYSVGASKGRFTQAGDGSMRFTGPMANARGRFSVKSTGKAQIDLVFDNDARASMSCVRGG